MKNEEQWSLDNRPHTRTKLEIFKQYVNVWLTIWNKQNWVGNKWYYIDLFAGRGNYSLKGENSYGSPLIFLEQLKNKLSSSKLRNDIKIQIYLVEENKENYNCLLENIDNFLKKEPIVSEFTHIVTFNDDCNKCIEKIKSDILNTPKNPLLAIIDPYGIKIKSSTIDEISSLNNPKEIFFNYILEGVRRVGGVVKKSHSKAELTQKEITTIQTFYDFIGSNQSIIDKNDIEILKSFVEKIFSLHQLKVIVYDMKYPDRDDIIYYLLFASKNDNVTKIIKDIFSRQKESIYGLTLWGKDFYEQGLLKFEE